MRGGRGGGRDFGGRGGRGGGFGGRGGGFGGRGGFQEGPPDTVVEAGTFSHPCEGEAVIKLTNEKVNNGPFEMSSRPGGTVWLVGYRLALLSSSPIDSPPLHASAAESSVVAHFLFSCLLCVYFGWFSAASSTATPPRRPKRPSRVSPEDALLASPLFPRPDRSPTSTHRSSLRTRLKSARSRRSSGPSTAR